jgi:hypothetical protein
VRGVSGATHLVVAAVEVTRRNVRMGVGPVIGPIALRPGVLRTLRATGRGVAPRSVVRSVVLRALRGVGRGVAPRSVV